MRVDTGTWICMCMCVCVCSHMGTQFVCMHVCVCIHTDTCIYVYRCVYVCSSMSMYFVYIRVCMCLYIRVGCVHSCVHIHSLKHQSCFRSATQTALLMLIEILVLVWVFWCTNQELWGPASPLKYEPVRQGADLALITRGVCGYC